MSKKLMLLAAGALSALAFAALPAVSSAVETQIHCPKLPCIGSISGDNEAHTVLLENDKGERIEATDGVDGSIELTTTTTGIVELKFTHVIELISGFKFTCNSPGQPAGVITTNVMTGHFVNLAVTDPAVLLTGVNVTFACAGFLTKTVTGNIIGRVTTPNCNVESATNVVKFNIKAPEPKGTQEQELWTGKSFDLISGTQSADTTTSAQTGTGNVKWEAGNTPTLTC